MSVVLLLLALTPADTTELIARARALQGTRFEAGGRARTPREGLDGQGLVYRALEAVHPCGWRSYPRDIEQLGEPVDPKSIKPGDIVILDGDEREAGLFVGDGAWLMSSPRSRVVKEVDLISAVGDRVLKVRRLKSGARPTNCFPLIGSEALSERERDGGVTARFDNAVLLTQMRCNAGEDAGWPKRVGSCHVECEPDAELAMGWAFGADGGSCFPLPTNKARVIRGGDFWVPGEFPGRPDFTSFPLINDDR